MEHKFTTFIQEAISLPSTILEGDPVLIYGAGNKGQEVARFLMAQGYVVSGFLDANAEPGQTISGIHVATMDNWLRNNTASRYSIVIAIHNSMVEIPPLQQSIKDRGFKQVLNIIELYNAFPGALPEHYWLTDKTNYMPFGATLDRLDAILADELSRQWLEAVVCFRLSGNYALLPAPSSESQYCPNDLPIWQKPLRFIDCGAFDGDTLKHLQQCGYKFEAVATFEPDPKNFQKLVQTVGDFVNVVCIPCALGAKTEMLRFNADSSASSHVSSSGTQNIQCVTLDESLPSFAPDFIKMDIEGAELDALRGAYRMISKHRPNLAISLYHTPAHLWQIPLLLYDWNLDYRLYIRGHFHNSFDLILYALPA
jgi:FkbM family methyltransferase